MSANLEPLSAEEEITLNVFRQESRPGHLQIHPERAEQIQELMVREWLNDRKQIRKRYAYRFRLRNKLKDKAS